MLLFHVEFYPLLWFRHVLFLHSLFFYSLSYVCLTHFPYFIPYSTRPTLFKVASSSSHFSVGAGLHSDKIFLVLFCWSAGTTV